MLGELQRSQQQFFFLTENIHQIFWIKDAKTARYDYISSAFERITGRRPQSHAKSLSPGWNFCIPRIAPWWSACLQPRS